MPAQSMEQLVSLCKRRGFIFQTNEIYGGLQGVYDYGPLGVELKENLKKAWWTSMVYSRDDVEGLDATILTNKKVLKYSGHEDTFTDLLTKDFLSSSSIEEQAIFILILEIFTISVLRVNNSEVRRSQKAYPSLRPKGDSK